jgi:diadenosine tetraphosphatase ApaH/serine/threonine PP2A family protein phosphatase
MAVAASSHARQTEAVVKAILGDVHGNLEALLAVLDQLGLLGVSDVYNLGDSTGYGPNPIECLDLAMSMKVVLLGCFDHAVLIPPDGYPPSAEKSADWTRDVLKSPDVVGSPERSRMRFLAGLNPTYRDADALYVHGSPHNPRYEYVFPEDIYTQEKMSRIGDNFDQLCFNAHTHIPGVFVEDGPKRWHFVMPSECNNCFRLDERRVICNVGSVGQPRDGDWRASFVLFDGSTIRFHRVEYDIETTIQKIYAEPELANFFGDRLRDGR